MKYDWLICGGGIHGVHLAARLIGDAKVPAERIRIIDPGEKLLARWHACSGATGMSHLRSPSVHHLGLSPQSLSQFAKRKGRRMSNPFVKPYNRPSLELFNAHCDSLIGEYGLDAIHIREKVTHCRLQPNGIQVTTATGLTLTASQIVLAIGSGENPAWPGDLPRDSARIQHIFEPGFTWPALDSNRPVLVLGGGISAGQVALRMLRKGHKVHVLSRHAMRKHQFDSDPGWLGPKNMTGFQRESCLVRRRSKIREARHRGSMPGDVRRALAQQIHLGNLYWHQDPVMNWSCSSASVSAKLSEEVSVTGQHLLLATGFCSGRPGGDLIDGIISEMQLEIAPCGFPVVDKALRWHPRIFVSGSLAELEIGPVARNIAGARRAGDRIIDALGSSK